MLPRILKRTIEAESLNKWRTLAGDLASEGLIVAEIADTLPLKGGRAVSWEVGLDMV